MNTLAIDIGGTKFGLVLFDKEAQPLARHTEATDRDGGPEWMIRRITEVAAGWQFGHCGIGFGGPVLFEDQRVATSTHVGGWSDYELPRVLEAEFGVKPVMDNDANLGGLGEAVYGAGRGFRPLFYMTLSTGIGGGFVPQGSRIFRGVDSFAGELGHMTIVKDGPACQCGSNGCFERMCSGLWLERDHGRSARELLADPDFVLEYVKDLALGLKTVIMLINPARIVIGGGLSKAGDALFEPLRTELRRQVPASWSHARIDVMPAALGDDSVLYGAFALANGF